jgi:hypothetical protein
MNDFSMGLDGELMVLTDCKQLHLDKRLIERRENEKQVFEWDYSASFL